MGCCSPFTAVTTASAADPGRHVNFTTGMVLGVDDYAQEFAYHSARDKWIVRDFLGYGTLSGLAVAVEDNGADGPRIRVTPGSAAAPSGQLICVGREQCGSLNAWLARDEIAEKITAMAAATPTPDKAKLNVFLTLCYNDCAVAEVPIPGEPCRSDENLMAPSRIADDYVLSFAWDPPPQAEYEALDALDAFLAQVGTGGANTPAAFAAALQAAEVQLQLALGIYPPDAPDPAAGDLDPIKVHGELEMPFRTALKRLWVTRLRPRVAAQRCGTASLPANDCVLLAQLWFPVVQTVDTWSVEGGFKDVIVDENARPLLLSTAVAQSRFGARVSDDASQKGVQIVTGDDTASPKARMIIVRSDAKVTIKMPTAADNAGTELAVKASGKGEVTLAGPGKTTIEDMKEYKLAVRGAVGLVSDGVNGWHVTSIVK